MKPVKKVYCKYCGTKIRAWRENAHKDWKSRSSHKSCWRKMLNGHTFIPKVASHSETSSCCKS